MQSSTWIAKWKKRHTFKLELTLIILLKAAFLTLLWHYCFSNPLGDHLNDSSMGSHVIYQSAKVQS